MEMGIMSRAIRNLSRRKIRATLVVIALGFCMAILIALPPGISANQQATKNLTSNLGDVIAQTEAAINQTLTQVDCSLTQQLGQAGGGPVIGGGGGSGPTIAGRYGGGSLGGGSLKPMNESYYSDIADVANVAAVAPMFQQVQGHNRTVTVQSMGGQSQDLNVTDPDYIITGVLLNADLINSYPILPTNITQGRNLYAGETNSVVMSQNCSDYFGVSVGDTVNILGKDFTVVGIYSPTGVADNQLVYMSLAEAQALTDNEGTVTSIKAFATSKDTVSSVASAISDLHPELNIETAQERLSQIQDVQSMYHAQLENAEKTMVQTQTQANGEMLIAVSATSVIVLFVMLYTVRERTKEIGTLKAIGASNGTVMSQFLVEGVLLSLLAGLVGVAIGIVAAPALSSVLLPAVGGSSGMVISTETSAAATTSAVVVTPELIAIALAASVVLGAIGSLYPAWRAAKIRPAEAMRYE